MTTNGLKAEQRQTLRRLAWSDYHALFQREHTMEERDKAVEKALRMCLELDFGKSEDDGN